MNLTSKSRYALKIMIDLAERLGVTVHRSAIAERQGIPLDYMDHVLSRLREAGLIDSTRGRGGGYQLAKDPGEISVLAIFMAVEDAFEPVQCLDGGTSCLAELVCQSRDAWGRISSAIHATLSGIILTQLVQTGRNQREQATRLLGVALTADSGASGQITGAGSLTAKVAVAGTAECRAPRRRAGGREVST